jgi:dienelactone hydrolase
VTSIAVVVGAALYFAVVIGLIGIYLPKPTGPYAVGRVSHDLVDSLRHESFVSDPDARREIVVTIYYPALPRRNSKIAPYVGDRMARFLARRLHVPAATAVLIHSHSYENVPIASGVFPVVLFLPGIGNAPLEYTSTIEDLASHGYVVAVLYPTYSVAVTVFSDGRVVALNDAGFRCESEPPGTSEEQIQRDRDAIGSVWVADARFTVARLRVFNGEDPLLSGHLDLDRVGIFGHSFGGAAAGEAVRADSHFQAGINMDGSPFRMTKRGPIVRPFLWMQSDYSQVTDDQLARIGMNRGDFDTRLQERQRQRDPFVPLLAQGSLHILEGATHNAFATDDAIISAVIPWLNDPLANIDGRRASTIINSAVVEFFNRYLKQENAKAK